MDIGQKAEQNLKGLVQTSYRLIATENRKFDLIVAPGTTGAFVCKLVEMIYKKLDKPFPPKLLLPIVRYKGEESPENFFDNSELLPDVIEQLNGKNLGDLKEILFIDDELYGGNALRECLKLILKYKQLQNITSETICTIVAEDQGGSREYNLPEVSFIFEFYEKGIDEYSNAITYFLSPHLEDPITEALGDKIGTHAVVNVLFDLPIRPKGQNLYEPKYTNEFNRLAEEMIPNLSELRNEAKEYTEKQIDQYISQIK
jgi:hypothetical protein